MEFIPSCLYMFRSILMSTEFFCAVFQSAILPIWLRAYFFFLLGLLTRILMYRDVPEYFNSVMLVTVDHYFICSLFLYVQRIIIQRFVPHLCVSLLFMKVCISFPSLLDVARLPSFHIPLIFQTFCRNHANLILSFILLCSSCIFFCFSAVCACLTSELFPYRSVPKNASIVPTFYNGVFRAWPQDLGVRVLLRCSLSRWLVFWHYFAQLTGLAA